MRRTNRPNLSMTEKLVLSFCFAMGTAMHAQGEAKTSQGTVNIALANAHGIVLLTDSVQSHHEADGWHPSPDPAQKLFQLDDKTVCSIAGFASETFSTQPQLNTEVTGIIADVRDQLSKHPVAEPDAKLRVIGFLVGFYIDLIANRHEVVAGPDRPSGAYEFEVIVAGYDTNGQPKLEKLVVTPVVIHAADGHNYWSHTTSTEVAQLGPKLVPLLGGIKEVSAELLNSPEKFGSNLAIRKYAESKKKNGGKSLTLDDMAALASEMAAQTAKRYPSVVGPPDQIAILTNGRILTFSQPRFPDPPRPMKIALMVGLSVQGPGAPATGPGAHLLWIRSQFMGIRNPPFRLDDQFFYGCEFRDSIVQYGGGLTDFGPTNTVVHSFIMPGYPVISEREMLRVLNGFPTGSNTKQFEWSHEPPNTSPLPPTLSPR